MSCCWYGGLLVIIGMDMLYADTEFGTVESVVIDVAPECSSFSGSFV